jgi:alcohol dehydrogenase class IV
MAHSLGGLLDLPHGECNAILLEHVIDFNFMSAIDRYLAIGRVMDLPMDKNDLSDSKNNLVSGIHEFRCSLGVNRTLGNIGVKQETITELAKKAYRDPCLVTNPCPATEKDLERIYTNAC